MLEQMDGARERLHVMNPYLTDPDAIDRIIAAARRGAQVRLVVSEPSNSDMATAASSIATATRWRGVEVWELTGTVHAKGAPSQPRSCCSPAAASSPQCSRSASSRPTSRAAGEAARPPGSRRLRSWAADKLTYYL
jgi:PLD-like domain